MTFPLIITVPQGSNQDEIANLRQAGWFVITTDRPDLVRLITPSTAADDGGALLKAALHALAMPRTPGVCTAHQEQNVMLAAIPMQATPQDDISMAEKRAILRDIANHQDRTGCGLLEACNELHRSHNDVRRWRKEVGAADARRAMRRAIEIYDSGRPLREAAQLACVTERDLTRALSSRGRRPYTTLHVAAYSRGHRTTAY